MNAAIGANSKCNVGFYLVISRAIDIISRNFDFKIASF